MTNHAENKLKHLEFIQGVINRLASNSFLLKGWSVTLVAAMFALAASKSALAFIYLAYIPTAIFWSLDAYFLWQERIYRALYAEVCEKAPETIDFSLNTEETAKTAKSWPDAFFSITLLAFYGALIVSIVTVTVLLF